MTEKRVKLTEEDIDYSPECESTKAYLEICTGGDNEEIEQIKQQILSDHEIVERLREFFEQHKKAEFEDYDYTNSLEQLEKDGSESAWWLVRLQEILGEQKE